MATYQNMSKDDTPRFAKQLTDIAAEVKPGGALKVLSPLDYHTAQQRKWYKGVCLKDLSDWNGETVDEWDLRLKALCNGNELLKHEHIYMGGNQYCDRLTIVGVGKKNLTRYIENIISKSIEMGWPVTPPDPELRRL